MSDKNLTITKSAAITLLMGLGLSAASGYNAARCAAKIKTLPATIDDAKKPEDKESKSLLKKILATLEAGGEVTVEDDPEAETKKGKGKAAAKPEAKKGKGKKAAAEEEEDEEDSDEDEESEDESEEDADMPEEDEEEETEEEEDDSDEDEEEEPAPKKSAKKGKKAAAGKTKKDGSNFKRAGGPDGVGVIGSILEFLKAANKDKPIDKKGLLAKLVKRFPDRDESSMKATINAQVPNRIAKEKKVNVKSNDNGYWCSGAAKPAKDE